MEHDYIVIFCNDSREIVRVEVKAVHVPNAYDKAIHTEEFVNCGDSATSVHIYNKGYEPQPAS